MVPTDYPDTANDLADRALIALCEGWPKSERVNAIFERLRAQKREIPLTLSIWQLLCVKASAEGVFRNLIAILRDRVDPNEFWDPHMTRPLIQRLRRDEGLAEMFERTLSQKPSSNEKASFPKLLAAAKGLTSSTRDWSVQEIDAQVKSDSGPEIGLDYTAGRFESVPQILLDVITKAV
jgi:hypothetical protein